MTFIQREDTSKRQASNCDDLGNVLHQRLSFYLPAEVIRLRLMQTFCRGTRIRRALVDFGKQNSDVNYSPQYIFPA